MRAFTIQDLLAETFSFPFPSPTQATAIRFCQEKLSELTNPADYVLWEVSGWNETNGSYDIIDRTHVIDLVELKES